MEHILPFFSTAMEIGKTACFFVYQNVPLFLLASSLCQQFLLVLFLSSSSLSLLKFYHECRSQIGYATLHSVIDSEQRSSVRLLKKWRSLLGVFEVSVERICIKLWTTSRFIRKQLDYSLSISMRDIWLGLRSRQLSRGRTLKLRIQLFNRDTIINQSARVFS